MAKKPQQTRFFPLVDVLMRSAKILSLKNQMIQLRDHLLQKELVEDYYDWSIITILSSMKVAAPITRLSGKKYIFLLPRITLKKIITFVWFMMLLQLDFRTRTKTSFQTDYGNVEEQSPNDAIPEELNIEAKKFFKMLIAAKNLPYDWCKNQSQTLIIG